MEDQGIATTVSSPSPLSSFSSHGDNPPQPAATPKRFQSISFPTGDMYSGQLLAASLDDEQSDLPTLHGVGVLSHNDGTVYKGEFCYGVKHGLGVTLFPNGDKHVGRYKDNVYDGAGTYTSADGAVAYVGGFVRGEIDGNGAMKRGSPAEASGDLSTSEMSSVASEWHEDPGIQEDEPDFGSDTVQADSSREEETKDDNGPSHEYPQKMRAGATLRGISRHVSSRTKALLSQRNWMGPRPNLAERSESWSH